MSDGPASPSIPQLPPSGDKQWSILAELAAEEEAELRRILRTHEEAPLSREFDDETLARRNRLDQALNRLTLLEIAYQTGLLAPPELHDVESRNVPVRPFPAKESLVTLFNSEAFLHYCDSYLYFGIRFLAERVSPAAAVAREKIEHYRKAESNWRPLALETPPVVQTSTAVAEKFFAIQSRERTPAEGAALLFLNGLLDKPLDYELWLRGLLAEADSDQEARFQTITDGLKSWFDRRVEFYLSMVPTHVSEAAESADGEGFSPRTKIAGQETAVTLGREFSPSAVSKRSVDAEQGSGALADRRRPTGGWTITDPAAARLGLADIYWIARLLRATVSSSGAVTYAGISWPHLLSFHANLQGDEGDKDAKADAKAKANAIRQGEEVIRSVFDFVCDLIQNAITVTNEHIRLIQSPDALDGCPTETKRWQHVFDEELVEVTRQRALRRFQDQPQTPRDPPPTAAATAEPAEDWSDRIKTGSNPLNLVGVAFSGGGIRSATFNLGVLQGLQEFDLLRNVDYLSTVSGGGFIGSWLVANVRRSAHWLGRVTDWSASIAHLRAYSNYLAPLTGILSADTWTMAASWARNAFLIQITGLAWLFALLLAALEAKQAFSCLGAWPLFGLPLDALLAFLAGSLVTFTVLYNLIITGTSAGEESPTSEWVCRLAVLPAWIGAFAIGSFIWREAVEDIKDWIYFERVTYSTILGFQLQPWGLLLVFTWLALVALALVSLQRNRIGTLWIHALWIASICTGVIYLALAGIFYLDRILASANGDKYVWFAFAFSPALVLLAFAVSIVLFIGFTGRNSNEGIREWWTRLGAWLGIYGLSGLIVTTAAVFGPPLMYCAWNLAQSNTIRWASVLSWAGTVVGGLFAGKSSRTGEGNKSPALQALAVTGGALFIVGAVLLSSTLLYFLLWKIFAPVSATYQCFLTTINSLPGYAVPIGLCVSVALGILFSRFFEINIFGLNQFYRNRIARCYLGASRTGPGARKPNFFTGFDFKDDIKLHKLYEDEALDSVNGHYRGPFPIVNCALNLAGSSDLSVKTRHSASFFLTPLRCGANRPLVGYSPIRSDNGEFFGGGIMLGQAVAVSGAAVSPNMGYNTSPLVAFLLTMFNVRLGWWFPNPGRGSWKRSGLAFSLSYLTRELFGVADERCDFLNVSDGGHFENLGVYELVRRRCKVIIACDGECDEELHFGSLGNLIRICETDFGAIIDLDVKSIRLQKDSYSIAHCAIGQIKYSNGSLGYLIYFKASVTGDEPVSVAQYRSAHPSFPHETTADQFFSEDQFESYRKLGQHVVEHTLRGVAPGQHPVAIAEKLADVLAAAGCPSEVFVKHSTALNAIWDEIKQTPALHPFLHELMGDSLSSDTEGQKPDPSRELCLGLELIQLMEDVFLDLRLDDFWEHPDNRGWAMLFMQWSRSKRFQEIWAESRQTFGIRFEHFCAARLGLPRDRPIIRV